MHRLNSMRMHVKSYCERAICFMRFDRFLPFFFLFHSFIPVVEQCTWNNFHLTPRPVSNYTVHRCHESLKCMSCTPNSLVKRNWYVQRTKLCVVIWSFFVYACLSHHTAQIVIVNIAKPHVIYYIHYHVIENLLRFYRWLHNTYIDLHIIFVQNTEYDFSKFYLQTIASRVIWYTKRYTYYFLWANVSQTMDRKPIDVSDRVNLWTIQRFFL